MKSAILILLSFPSFSYLFGQDSLYSKVFYSNAVSDFVLTDIDRTSYGNLGQIGHSFSSGLYNFTDSLGNVLATKTYTDGLSGTINFNSIIQLSDTTFAIAGYHQTNGSNLSHGLLLKIDTAGTIIWSKDFSGPAQSHVYFKQVIKTQNGNLLVIGSGDASNEGYVLYCDDMGNQLSSKAYSLSGSKLEFTSVTQPTDTTFALVGNVITNQVNSGLILSLDDQLNAIWSRTQDSVHFTAIKNTSSSLLAFGIENNNSYNTITQVDLQGISMQFQNYFTNSGYNNIAFPHSISLLNDSTFVQIYGEQYAGGTIVKYSLNNQICELYNIQMVANSIIQREHGGFYLLGNGPLYGIKKLISGDHSALIRTDSLFLASYCFSNSGTSVGDVVPNSLIGVLLNVQNSSSIADFTLMSSPLTQVVETIGCVDYLGDLDENSNSKFTLYPNPTLGNLNIETNQSGGMTARIISSEGKCISTHNIEWNNASISVEQLHSGIYFIEISDAKSGENLGKEIFIKE